LILLISFVSCSSPLYTPTKENIPSTSNIEDLKKGREIYVSKCGSCHTLRLPEKFNREGWKDALEKMQPKAKITDEDRNLILDYLSKGKE